jgi:Fe-S cluster assembly protein SufD
MIVKNKVVDEFRERYLALCESYLKTAEDSFSADIIAHKKEAFAHFKEEGFPTLRDEKWRFTNLKSFYQKGVYALKALDPEGLDFSHLPPRMTTDCCRLVFVDGVYNKKLSDDCFNDAVEIKSIAEYPKPHHFKNADDYEGRSKSFMALNALFCEQGVEIIVRKNQKLDKPIEVLFFCMAENLQIHPRLYVKVEEGSEATFFEHHVSKPGNPIFSNMYASVIIEKNAKLLHYQLQNHNADSVHIEAAQVNIGDDAVYKQFILTLGAGLSRQDVRANLSGQNIDCHMSGAYQICGNQHADFSTFIHHQDEASSSREVYKGVIGGKASAVFQGKILVDQIAQKTDGYQINRALLLSDEAQINSKPELEIYADDVKCSHGATTGDIDEDSLFYLRSRGIPEAEAKKILVRAFLAEAIEEIESEEIRKLFLGMIGV